jgi:O-antigen/teichoic acid export membrane protein
MKKFLEGIKKFFSEFTKDDILRRIIANTGYLFSAQGFVAVLSIVRGILEARLLGVGGLGLLAVINTFSGSLNKLTSFRIGESVVRFVRKYEEQDQQEKSKAIFKSAILFEAIGAVAAFLLIYLLAPLGVEFLATEWLDEPKVVSWFIIFGLYVLGNFMYDSSKGLLQVFDRFKEIAAVNAVQSIITFILVVAIYFMGGGFEAILIARIINKLIGAIGMTSVALVRAAQHWGSGWWQVPISALKEDRKDLFRFVTSTNLSASISLIAKDSESLWISGFLSTTAAGYYDLARRLIGYMQMPVDHLASTTYPELSREIAKEKWSSVQNILKRGSTLGVLYMTPFILAAVFFGKPIISLYGEEFLPAYPAWLILLVGYFVVNAFFWNRVGLLALNRPVYPTIVNFIGMVIKVAGTIILVPQFGFLVFAGLLSGYYIFTVSLAALRVHLDVRQKVMQEV